MKKIWRYLKKFFTVIRNIFLCLRYPFLKSRNFWSGKFLGYSYTRYEDIPLGWRKAFGKQFLKELKCCLKKNKELKTFRFLEIKEKYGTLRLSCACASHETYEVLNKYEALSEQYCINCGEKAKYITDGWIQFLCERCFKRDMLCRNQWRELSPEEESKYLEEHLIKN